MAPRLTVGEEVELIVEAKMIYSEAKLAVEENQEYQFDANTKSKWCDWLIKTDANGYVNPLASLIGLRVKSAKCFCLCGCYNDADVNTFRIGASNKILIAEAGMISFFANDCKGFYFNNKGSVPLLIKRLR